MMPNALATLLRTFSVTGLLFGVLFFAGSLLPSLVPREPLIQGLLSGFCFSAGYGLGHAARGAWRALRLPAVPDAVLARFRLTVAGLCLLAGAVALWNASGWQNRQRALMAMAPVDGIRPWLVVLIGVLVFAALLLLARLFGSTRRTVSGWLRPWLPSALAWVLGVCLSAGLFFMLGNRVLAHGAMRAFDASYSALDALIEETSAQPTGAHKSGSPESLLAWDALGRTGREWLAASPDRARIARLTGKPALEPIRVYAGLNSAPDVEARARLALDELVRVGAFKRSALVIATPTGTGWVDPKSQSALEYVLLGDVATVSMQYSYLASWLALLAEPEYGQESARALFDAVYGHWRALPVSERPKLYLHGLSLGALNSEKSHDLYQVIDTPYDGAFWVGAPFASATWRHITDGRNPGSPVWLPEYRDGSVIRFAGQGGWLDRGHARWGRFRIIYLQYASDAVTFYDPATLWREPEWLRGERGPDVSPDMRWLPGITFLQTGVDLMQATKTPVGYGHVYAFDDYLDGWAALTDAPGWSPAELQALKAAVAAER